MNYFVTGINTGSGKTVVSAILCQALQADYWKPVQCGSDERDLDRVKSLVNNGHSLFFDEAYCLKEPVSPHQAAHIENTAIALGDIELPDTGGNDLIIEGAGGVLVPLNDEDMIIDIAARFGAEVILVADLYLGSINHTLLTVNELKARGLTIKGIVFNGADNSYSREIIGRRTGLKTLLHLKQEPHINEAVITKYAIELFNNW